MKILFTIIISLIFYSCQYNEPANAPGSGSQNTDGREVELTNYLNIYYCFYPGNSSNRPLGNDPIPMGQPDLINAFANLDFSGINVTLKNPPNMSLNDFLITDTDDQRNLLKNYEQRNSMINREYDKIHVISIPYDLDIYSPYGLSIKLKNFIVDTVSGNIRRSPAFCIVQVGKIDSFFNANSYDVNKRKKLIERTTVHEIGHNRGLLDIAYPYWSPHCNHAGVDSAKCVMWETYLMYFNIDNVYPPRFCHYHRKVIKDSLYNKIINGFDIGPSDPDRQPETCN